MTIRLYNTMIREKEDLIPRDEGRIAMYVCGPTTYNFIHLGNARPLVVFDTVRRYLEYRGFQVTYVQNFTDIDDKIINRAQEEKEDPLALAAKYVQEYFKDADALNVRRADIHPKVSEHLDDIIAMIRAIIENGYAYVVEGDVYFNVRKLAGYGKLSGRSLEEMQAGARVEVDTRKQDPMDFALWKAAKPGEPKWESPWGPGRPGWHIECSAMSMKYLGPAFDIHGGGFDLIFPHHENEIAQSEAATGKPFARYWMHNGFITVNREKMSKSLGNFFTVREILAKFRPDVVRFYLLSTHYRSPLDFDDGKLLEAQKGLDRLKATAALLDENLERAAKANIAPGEIVSSEARALAEKIAGAEKAFQDAMDDDFNTALAIAAIFDISREINAFINRSGFELNQETTDVLKKARDFYKIAGGQVLGVFYDREDKVQDDGLVDGLMDLILYIRQEARAKKDWATADQVRDSLKELGIVIEDTAQGPRWKRG